MGSWCHLRLPETNMSVSRVKKWLTNNVPQILTPLTGMSFPGLHDSCDRVIVFVTRKFNPGLKPPREPSFTRVIKLRFVHSIHS